MKYYKDNSGEVYAYTDQQVLDGVVPEGFILMTQTEINAHLDIPATPEDKLSRAKTQRKNQITQECLERINGGFEYDGHIYDSDEISRSNIVGACTSVTAGIPLPEGFTWRDKDNNDVPMTGPDVIALGGAALAHVQTQYVISWGLKAQIEVATLEQLEQIQWPS